MRKFLRNFMLFAVMLITMGVTQKVAYADTTTPSAVTTTPPAITLDTQPTINTLDELNDVINGTIDTTNNRFRIAVSFDGATLQLIDSYSGRFVSDEINQANIVRIYWTKTDSDTKVLPVNTPSIPTDNIWNSKIQAYILVNTNDNPKWYLANMEIFNIRSLKHLQLVMNSMTQEKVQDPINIINGGLEIPASIDNISGGGYIAYWVASDTTTGEKRFIQNGSGRYLDLYNTTGLNGKTLTFYAFPIDRKSSIYYTGSILAPAGIAGNIEVPKKIELGEDCNIKLSNLTASGKYYIVISGGFDAYKRIEITDKSVSSMNIKEYLSKLTKSTLVNVALVHEEENGWRQEQISAYRIQVNNSKQIQVESRYYGPIPYDSKEAKMYIRNLDKDKDYCYELEYKYANENPIILEEKIIPKGGFSIVQLPELSSNEYFSNLTKNDLLPHLYGANFKFNLYLKTDKDKELVSTTRLMYGNGPSDQFPTKVVEGKTSGTITIPYATRANYRDELYYSVNGVEHALNSDSIEVSNADADSDGLVNVKIYSVASEASYAV